MQRVCCCPAVYEMRISLSCWGVWSTDLEGHARAGRWGQIAYCLRSLTVPSAHLLRLRLVTPTKSRGSKPSVTGKQA